jgi:cytoskeletal protein CcmA (bactofilin family)
MAWKLSGKAGDADPSEWTGFLDKGVKVEGTLEVAGVFRFDAHLKGTIVSDQSVILGENAQLEGQVEGNHVVVAGRVEGTIRAKGRVEIQPKGVVRGEIHTPCLVIEAGGMFDGRCHMSSTPEAATEPLTIPLRAATQT